MSSMNSFFEILQNMAEKTQKEYDKTVTKIEHEIHSKENQYESYSNNRLAEVVKDNQRTNIERMAAYQKLKERHVLKNDASDISVDNNKYMSNTGSNKNDSLNSNKHLSSRNPKDNVRIKKGANNNKQDCEDYTPSEKDLQDFDIVDCVWDVDETDKQYRKTALFFSESNNGWRKCPKCGRNFRVKQMDADHIYPQSHGEDNSQYNLQMLCAHCNRSKQDDTSDTEKDLSRRRSELEQLKAEDYEFLKIVEKMLEEEN